MKKTIQILAFAITLIIVSLSFTGCSQSIPSEMHATYSEKDNNDTITYNGEKYIILTNNDSDDLLYNNSHFSCIYGVNFSIIHKEYNMYYTEYLDTENFIFVTPSGVASSSAEDGDIYYVSVDKNYLLYAGELIYDDNHGSVYLEESNPIYCKADMYEEIQNKLDSDKNYTLYGYSCCKNKTEHSDTHDHEYFYLGSDENDAINSILENTEDSYTAIDWDWYFALDNRVYLDRISDDKLCSNGYIAICTTASGDYCIEDENENYYDIPEEYKEMFDELMQTAQTRGYFYYN